MKQLGVLVMTAIQGETGEADSDTYQVFDAFQDDQFDAVVTVRDAEGTWFEIISREIDKPEDVEEA